MRFISRRFRTGLLVAGIVAICGVVNAAPMGDPLLPNDTDFLISLGSASPGTLLASMTSLFSYSVTGGSNSGEIRSAVYLRDGTLDFYYQVFSNASSKFSLARETNVDFATLTTDVFTRTDGSALVGANFADNGDAPISADRDAGSTVGWNFTPPTTSKIKPGEHSQVLVISTDATLFKVGDASIIDGGTATVRAFSPGTESSKIPEPASMALIGGGLIALGFVSRLRRGKA